MHCIVPYFLLKKRIFRGFFMLKTQFRLKKRKEFNYIYRKGEKFNSENLSLIVIKSKFQNCKIGLSVSNKVGNAVVRNKLKRQFRAILAPFVTKIQYKNFILVAHPTIIDKDFTEKQNEIIKLLKKGKLINE